MARLRRLDWFVILAMDVWFNWQDAKDLPVPWQTKVRFLWTTTIAMWRHGE